jgi:hypothetical protein
MKKRMSWYDRFLILCAVVTVVFLLATIAGRLSPSCTPGPKPPGLSAQQWAPERATMCENGQ